ncbi:MAG: acetaldehyde dehydrogenase (acetylating) [Candidatus Omnitrophica bacterium]|nr:acetaldehyde dehydrogenase (acetylating) [Candidatus Omnitrophota bacterium]
MKKTPVAIIGTGNIGTDLLIKIQRSSILECVLFTGRRLDSRGMQRARLLGVPISDQSIKAIQRNHNICDIVFDATSAKAHQYHAPILKKLGKIAIDLTPSKVGKMCIPVINMNQCLDENNVNLVTCGGQAAIPIAHAIMRVHPETEYIEVVASIASKSAGLGTRDNIDEFTQTTGDAILNFTGVPRAKAIIILNPAEPPVLMHNTIYAQITKPKIKKMTAAINDIVNKVQKYVPGYKVTVGPVAEGNRVTVMIEVVGLGDFLPKYSGNLDIITCAAVNIAESFAQKKIRGKVPL